MTMVLTYASGDWALAAGDGSQWRLNAMLRPELVAGSASKLVQMRSGWLLLSGPVEVGRLVAREIADAEPWEIADGLVKARPAIMQYLAQLPGEHARFFRRAHELLAIVRNAEGMCGSLA